LQVQIQSKLHHVGTTIFTIMSSLAAQHKAINLGQGFSDFGMNEELVALVNEAMKSGHNQYVHMNGYMPLRESIAEKVSFLYNTNSNPDTQITVTPGGTYALFTAFATVLQPGDEAIVFEPAYDCYIPQIELTGAKAVTIPLLFPEYKIDWQQVKAAVNEKTRAIVINSPQNPTGAVLSKEDIRQLNAIATDSRIVIISDEVYEHLIFDGMQHESILKYPELLERSFVCFSFGKVYNCTGWKLGYAIAPDYLMSEFRKIHQFNCFTCDTPKQVALANFLKNKDQYLHLKDDMQRRRDYFLEQMKGTRFTPLPSHGSYFQIYSYASISDEGEKDFAIRLTKETGVTTIPVSSFYRTPIDHQVLRFCFSKKEETLQAAAAKLSKV